MGGSKIWQGRTNRQNTGAAKCFDIRALTLKKGLKPVEITANSSDEKLVDYYSPLYLLGTSCFRFMPLRYMGSVTGPDSKHWASEICTVPVIGFQAYSDNNNGKKTVASKCMQNFRRCTNNNIKKCLFHHLLEELLEAVWKCISPIAKFLIRLQVFYAWTYLNRIHPSSIHIQDAKHFCYIEFTVHINLFAVSSTAIRGKNCIFMRMRLAVFNLLVVASPDLWKIDHNHSHEQDILRWDVISEPTWPTASNNIISFPNKDCLSLNYCIKPVVCFDLFYNVCLFLFLIIFFFIRGETGFQKCHQVNPHTQAYWKICGNISAKRCGNYIDSCTFCNNFKVTCQWVALKVY